MHRILCFSHWMACKDIRPPPRRIANFSSIYFRKEPSSGAAEGCGRAAEILSPHMSDTRQIEDPTLQRVTAQGDYLWKTCDYVVENLRWLQKRRVAGLDEFRERAQ